VFNFSVKPQRHAQPHLGVLVREVRDGLPDEIAVGNEQVDVVVGYGAGIQRLVKARFDRRVAHRDGARRGLTGEVQVGPGTIEDIDASLAKATTVANAIRANLEAQAKETKVPVGAPTRGEISLEGLSPREKIAAGIQQGSQR